MRNSTCSLAERFAHYFCVFSYLSIRIGSFMLERSGPTLGVNNLFELGRPHGRFPSYCPRAVVVYFTTCLPAASRCARQVLHSAVSCARTACSRGRARTHPLTATRVVVSEHGRGRVPARAPAGAPRARTGTRASRCTQACLLAGAYACKARPPHAR